MNTAEKVNLIKNSPTTDEIVTEEELTKLFDENSSPN
ncbi:MAG: tyrosine--tRNA ligase, partial [Nitrosopumilus sp.]|nr:tyrosine--tRNA ligase [Nitrosopumilus sp.]